MHYLRYLVDLLEYVFPVFVLLGLASPLLLIWGWSGYWDLPNRSSWRSRASLIGLSAPIISVGLWGVSLILAWSADWHTWVPINKYLALVGLLISLIGAFAGFLGRPRLILATLPASLGSMALWVTTSG